MDPTLVGRTKDEAVRIVATHDGPHIRGGELHIVGGLLAGVRLTPRPWGEGGLEEWLQRVAPMDPMAVGRALTIRYRPICQPD